MKLRGFLKDTFGKDVFSHLKSNEILEERIRAEKKVEMISDEVAGIQDKIQDLMLRSKGKPMPLKLLNIQKIKALRMESATKQEEANQYIRQLSLLLLLEAMRDHQKSNQKNTLIEKVLNSDVDKLQDTLFHVDIRKAIEEGKIDSVKEKLQRVFAKGEMPTDPETHELMSAIDDLERVDEEQALRMAGQKAKNIVETQKRDREAE